MGQKIEKDDLERDVKIELYKALVFQNNKFLELSAQYGQATVKSLVLINGGALVAMLTYLANSKISLINGDPSTLFNSAIYYVLGLVLGVAVGGIGYLNFQLNEAASYSPWKAWNFILNNKVHQSSRVLFLIPVSAWIAVIFALGSGGGFFAGSWCFLSFLIRNFH